MAHPEQYSSLIEAIKSWKIQRIFSHEEGHTPEPLDTFYPEGRDTEIELFNPAHIHECLDTQVGNSPFEIPS